METIDLYALDIMVCHGILQEDDYIPHVKEFIGLQKQFEKPYAAGNAIARQQNKKPASKAKAKAKSKA